MIGLIYEFVEEAGKAYAYKDIQEREEGRGRWWSWSKRMEERKEIYGPATDASPKNDISFYLRI